jgi:glycine cleavage system aminomethyltransferase T
LDWRRIVRRCGSYGGDTDGATNPFEVRLEKYIDLDVPDDVIGIDSLRRIHQTGPKRRQLGVVLEGSEPTQLGFLWHRVSTPDGKRLGDLTNCAWSYRLKRNIGFGLVDADCKPGDRVRGMKDGQAIAGELVELPFL